MLIAALSLAHATTFDIYAGEDLFAVLDGLQAGDEVVVHAGTWSTQQPGGSWQRAYDWQGTVDAPIVVRAASGDLVVLEADPAGSENGLDLSGQHFTLAGFEVAFGSHGIRMATSAHVLLEDLHIHDTADVGLSMNRPGHTYEDITVRGTEIHDTAGTGECMYLGCNDDGCQVFDSVIEWNWCHDTMAGSQGDGIELKTGSYNTVVRHNVVHDVRYPGITLYGAMGRGNNTIEGNVVWNSGDNGIQVVNEVTVVNNIVVNSGNNGIQVKASQGELPHDLWIAHNTVDGAGDACFRGNDLDGGSDGIVANNVFHCEGANAIRLPAGVGALQFVANAVAGVDEGPAGSSAASPADFSDPVGLDYYPSATSGLIDAADPAAPASDDWNCLSRAATADIGAYEVTDPTNPGWIPTPGFKICAGNPGTGTGSGGTATGTGGTATGAAGTGTGTGGPGTDPTTGDTKGDCGCATTQGPSLGWLAVVSLLGRRTRLRTRRD